jgi:hypothetical protein
MGLTTYPAYPDPLRAAGPSTRQVPPSAAQLFGGPVSLARPHSASRRSSGNFPPALRAAGARPGTFRPAP